MSNTSLPDPYGRITTHTITGQQFFYRWPESPYLDNAKECIEVVTYSDMRQYAAAVTAAARDCRTCRNTITQYGVTRCNSTVVCTNADRYKPLPPVRLWKTT